MQFKDGHIFIYLEKELHHFSVDKTVNWFSVHMSDEVSSFESSFICRPAVFYVLFDRQIMSIIS